MSLNLFEVEGPGAGDLRSSLRNFSGFSFPRTGLTLAVILGFIRNNIIHPFDNYYTFFQLSTTLIKWKGFQVFSPMGYAQKQNILL
jgi:hypothetical protein